MAERLLPRPDTGVCHSQAASEALLIAISQTLNTPRENIQLFDSFIEIGGNQKSAESLRQVCRSNGIDISLEDIMTCHTLAELQTRVKPWTLTKAPNPIELNVEASSSHVKKAQPAAGLENGSVPSSSADKVLTPAASSNNLRPQISVRSAYSASSYGSIPSNFSFKQNNPIARSVGQDLESLLKSSPRVSNVCLVTPRAGPFDGQLVALVKISSPTSPLREQTSSDEISLSPASQRPAQKREIRSLRMAVQEWDADSRRPQIWIPLQAMAELEDGRPDTRKLQTWVQNLGQTEYKDTMQLQIPEPRRRAQSSVSRRQKVLSWAESRRSAWTDNDSVGGNDCDDMECFPLAPMQQLFFTTSMDQTTKQASSQTFTGPGLRYSQSITLRILGGAEDSDIEAAVEAMVARHSMLRARFRPVHDYWVQVVMPQAPNSYALSHHPNASEEEMVRFINQAQAAINPTEGPVFVVKHFKNGSEHLLYLVAHQLVVDPISWRIMVHDLDELLREGSLHSEGSIPFPHWVDYQSYEMSQRLFQPTLPFTVTPANVGYWGLEKDLNFSGGIQTKTFSFSTELTSILQKACLEVLRTDTADVFLASLLLSFARVFTDRRLPTLWKREHGRDVVHEDFNIMETVGWFTSLCPIGVGIEPTTDLIQVIKLMKDTRRAIPRDGIPFFSSEVSNTNGASAGIPVEVVLNWIDNQQISHKNGILEPVRVPGQTGSVLSSHVGPYVGRIALFEISVAIDDSGAQVEFAFNKNSKPQAKIELWMHTFEHLVLEAVGRMRYHEPELTLSDVPLLRTSYNGLAKLGSDRLSGSGLPHVKEIETIYPISPTQQEILISQSQSMYSFHVHGVYELRSPDGSPIEATRLCEAWERIVANKPALRSIFIDGVSRDGLFDRVVLKKISPNMLFIESSDPAEALSNLPPLKTPQAEPRHRLTVCNKSSTTMVRIDASQAICDLMSIHHLVSELCTVYADEQPTHNEALHRTYLYHISSLDTAYSLEIWKAELAGTRPCIFPRLTPAIEEAMPHPFALEVTREQIFSFCQLFGVHSAAVIQLAWSLVLRVFINTDSVVFGYQFEGRDEELLQGINQAVGSFANILPCAVDVHSHQSLEEVLGIVNEAFETSNKHQSLTMAEIQHALRLEEGELFNTCLLFQDSDIFTEYEETSATGLEFKTTTLSRRTDCDISLTATFANGKLHANLSSRFLSDLQTKSVVHSFEAAVKNILEHPTRLISEVDLFTDREYARHISKDVETSQQSQKIDACLHELILRHGQTQPNAPAIHSWDGDMNYIQLVTLVAKLRTYLVNLGVGPGMLVPIVMEKNRWAPVMLLAVLQTGASFVALDCQDQATAKSTIRYLGPRIVLAAESAWRELGGVVINLVIVNDAFFAMLPSRMSYLSHEATPEHAACAFITPKRTSSGASRSIYFTHSSLCSVFAAHGPALKLNNESRVLQLSAFNVDIALVEILGTMFHGGCVCIPSSSDRATNLEATIDQMHVNWSYMTGVVARKMTPSQVPTLKTIVFRTRKLDHDTYGPWLQGRNVLLAYGAPDVCPLGISITAMSKAADLGIILPPISGRFWILNPDNPRKLMPLGSIGELAIDSPIVTPDRFDPELPFQTPRPKSSGAPDRRARYLKTGHRVRYMDDGNIQFISSAHDEIVLNGQSVDVADVEQRIRRCLGPGVDVTVDKICTRDSVRTIAAFLELGDTLFHGQEDLANMSTRVRERSFIAKKLFEASLESPEPGTPRLPAYSIPEVYIPLKNFPMSTSLKINRRKLLRMAADYKFSELVGMSTVPNPQDIQRVVLGQKPLPLTRPEEVMRAIWASVLGISPIDIKGTSNFLLMGGNRYLASELVVACRKVGIRVSLADIFNGATLTDASLSSSSSEHIAKRDLAKQWKDAAPMRSFDYKFVKETIAPKMECRAGDILDISEASSEQIRNLELGMYSPRADISCLALEFNGQMSPEKLESVCEALTNLHPVLRTAFVSHENQTYQVLCGSFRPSFERGSCSASELESETETLIKREQNIPFRPNVPVTGFTFLDAEDQGTLIIRVSKTQVDDASAPLLVQDLINLYEDANGISAPSSFYQYMRGSRRSYANGLGYWTVQLKDAKMTEVVTHSKPCKPTSQFKTIKETAQISSFINNGITPDTMIKAAWAMVLATISGQDDVLFGEMIHGHNIPLPEDTDLSNMVGPLTNTIPVRVRFPALHSAPIDLMQCIQRQRESNYHFEAIGMDELRRRVCTEWPSWTQYSTVVHHRSSTHVDGSATFNIGGTTFTYKCVGPEVRDLPDMLVSSMMESSERVKLEIRYPEDRVDEGLVQDCMRLLMAAMDTLTHPDTLTQPMLQSAEEIRRTEKRIPLESEQQAQKFKVPVDHLLVPEQRGELEAVITETWSEVLNISTRLLSEDRMQYTPFFSRGNSLLCAHWLANTLNQKLLKLSITGIETINTFTAEDIIDSPTISSQLGLIAKRLRDNGSLSLPLYSDKPTRSKTDPLSAPRPKTSHVPSNTTNTLGWRGSFRLLRGRESKTSMRSLSIKHQAWKKAKEPKRSQSTSPLSEGSPVPQESPMPDIPELMDMESMSRLMLPRTSHGSDRSSDTTIANTVIENKATELESEEYPVSPLSPPPSDTRQSKWGTMYEAARTMTPLGFQIASK